MPYFIGYPIFPFYFHFMMNVWHLVYEFISSTFTLIIVIFR